MCDCAKLIAEKIKGHVVKEIEKEPGYQGVNDAYFTNQTLVLSKNGLTHAPIWVPFTVKYTRKAKNGNVREYKRETSIRPSFCPFCGKEYGKKEAQ